MSSSTDKAHDFLEVKDYHIFIKDVKLKYFQIHHSILYWSSKYLNQNPLLTHLLKSNTYLYQYV